MIINQGTHKNMKKLKWMLPCACIALFSLAACSDDASKENQFTNLTPDEHKEKLEQIGLDAISKINPQDHELLLETSDYFIEIADDGDLNIDRNNTAVQAVAQLFKSVTQVCRTSNVGAMSRYANADNDLYAAAQYFGIYTYDPSNHTWTRTDSNNALELHFTFNNQAAIISISKSGNETKVDLFENDGTNYQAMVPEHAVATMQLGNTELCKFNIDMTVNNSTRSADIVCNLNANNYIFQANTHADQTKANCTFSLNVKGEELIKAEASVNGQNMTNDDKINDIINENGKVEDLFNNANAQINIMQEAVIKTSCTDIKGLANALDNLADQYPSWEEQRSQLYIDKQAGLYNQYVTAELYYTDSDNAIAELKMQSHFVDDDYNAYYELDPVITFVSDESTFSLGSYFDDVSFNDLIDSAEALSDQYKEYLQYLIGE
jgi:hypothetical protein